MTEAVKINLGSGHWKLEGWVNVDIDAPSEPDVLADLGAGLPFADGSARALAKAHAHAHILGSWSRRQESLIGSLLRSAEEARSVFISLKKIC